LGQKTKALVSTSVAVHNLYFVLYNLCTPLYNEIATPTFRVSSSCPKQHSTWYQIRFRSYVFRCPRFGRHRQRAATRGARRRCYTYRLLRCPLSPRRRRSSPRSPSSGGGCFRGRLLLSRPVPLVRPPLRPATLPRPTLMHCIITRRLPMVGGPLRHSHLPTVPLEGGPLPRGRSPMVFQESGRSRHQPMVPLHQRRRHPTVPLYHLPTALPPMAGTHRCPTAPLGVTDRSPTYCPMHRPRLLRTTVLYASATSASGAHLRCLWTLLLRSPHTDEALGGQLSCVARAGAAPSSQPLPRGLC
jgi:hypothetical protein